MSRFTETAREATSKSFVMEGKTKVKMGEIISKYPEGVTIVAFDIMSTIKNGKSITYPALNIAEDNTIFFCGGFILNKICQDWADLYAGNCKAASKDLADDGGVKVKFTKTTTKEGNNLTSVEIIA